MAEQFGGQSLNRPQRFQHPQLEGEIDIPTPPQQNEDIVRSLLLTALPLVGVLVLPLFYLIAGGSNRGVGFVLPMFVMGGISLLSAILIYADQNKQRRQREVKQRAKYRRMLERRVTRLQAGIDLQRHIQTQNYPHASRLNSLISEGNAEFWNHRLTDEDFSVVRVGVGRMPSRVAVSTLDPDLEAVDIRLALDVGFNYRIVPDAPLTLNLAQTGSLGVVGSSEQTLRWVYGVLAQLAVFNAPDDLSLYLFSTRPHYQRWSWMRWLPHTSSTQTGGFPNHIAYDDEQARHLLARLANVAQDRLNQAKPSYDHYIVVVVDTLSTLRTEPIFSSLMQIPGITVLCLADNLADVPAECTASVVIAPSGDIRVLYTGAEGGGFEGGADFLERAQVELIARKLVAYHVPRKSGSTRIPNTVNFLQLEGVETIAQLEIQSRWLTWRQRLKEDMLPFGVPIGNLSFSDLMIMDLSEDKHGPHGLIAGTTGAGKSELLQTLVSALAVEHSVEALNFLLIDFKGGSTFDVFKDLPHTVGIITNLSDPESGTTAKIEALRAIDAIRAENERRQQILKRVHVKDIHDYHLQFSPNWEPLPHLLILIDEFAELANDLPNFIPELVSTVRVGRSLGIHLLLAMQRPFGYVTPEMSANLQLRICLRVQNAQDSAEMIGTPEASALPTEPRGRAFFKAGSASPLLFQVARVGVDYLEDEKSILRQRRKTQHVEVLRREQLVETRTPQNTYVPTENAPLTDDKSGHKPLTLAQALVHHMHELHRMLNAAPARKVLPDTLSPRILLDQLLNENELAWQNGQWIERSAPPDLLDIPFGLIDDLHHQSTRRLTLTIGHHGGHKLIVGVTGSGKTTLVRTLLWSIARMLRPDEVTVYILNFAGRGMDQFERLPHVGGVIGGSESERLSRLLSLVQEQMRVRSHLFSQVKASSLAHYNAIARENKSQILPAIILIVHNFVEFRNMFFRELDQKAIDEFTRFVREGQSFGLQLIITATQVGDVPYSVRSLIDSRIAMRLSEKSDYTELIGSLDGREINPRPGSGILSERPPVHVQIALPTNEVSAEGYLIYAQGMIEAMRSAASMQGIVSSATPIATLPLSVTLDGESPPDALPPVQGLRTTLDPRMPVLRAPYSPLVSVVGMDGVSLNPVHLHWLEAGQHFLITGSTQSGKTTLLKTLLLGIADRYAPNEARMFVTNVGNSSVQRLRILPHMTLINSADSLVKWVTQWMGEFNWRRAQSAQSHENSANLLDTDDESTNALSFPALIIAIDDYDQLRDAPGVAASLDLIAQMTRRRPELNVHIVVSADVNGSVLRPDTLIRTLRQNGSGFTLVSVEGVEMLGAPVSAAMRREQLVEGRGYRIGLRRAQVMQFAQVQNDRQFIRDIQNRWQGIAPFALHEVELPDAPPTASLPLKPPQPAEDDDFNLLDDMDRGELLQEYQKSQGHQRIVSVEEIQKHNQSSTSTNS